MENHYFGYKHKISFGVVLLLVLAFVLTSTVTLALFFGSDWASSKVTMSGKVQIEAVGKGTAYESIEDTHTSNLMVTLGDNYGVLIPGMDISLDANCKVYKSTTKPHLRADFNMILYDKDTGESVGSEYTDEHRFLVDMYASLQTQVYNNGWYLHTDGYFYYIGDTTQTATGGGVLTC